MTTHRFLTRTAAGLSMLLLASAWSDPAAAHCDSMDGPVVKDAQTALAGKNVTPVLKWVRAEDEQAIRDAFAMTLEVREESEAAQHLADRYFFETLVRLHRASEGEGFTGLKPAGSVEPGIAAADQALESGSVDRLADEITATVRHGITERFADASEKRQLADESVAQGREYVAAYVQFTHFVEAVDHLTSHGASPKHRESEESAQ
jgi:hypothetical protein